VAKGVVMLLLIFSYGLADVATLSDPSFVRS
jgi:hypothetical protein